MAAMASTVIRTSIAETAKDFDLYLMRVSKAESAKQAIENGFRCE